jgi:hypothetical protein
MHLLTANAQCQDCNWNTKGKNSMGNAAKHYQRTEHFVQLELYYGHSFGQPKSVTEPNTLLQDNMFKENHNDTKA